MNDIWKRRYGSARQKSNYASFLGCILAVCGLAMAGVYQFGIVSQFPEAIYLYQNEEQTLDFGMPVSAVINVAGDSSDYVVETLSNQVDESGTQSADITQSISTPVSNTLSVKASEGRQYEMGIRLWGIMPVKTISLEVVSPKKVYLSGEPVGIYLRTNGVLVIDTGSFSSVGQTQVSPAMEILQTGDYILKIGESEVNSKKDVIAQITACQGKELVFTILRGGEVSQVALTPVQDEQGVYKAGIWVRDSAQGIGTVTYLTEDGEFGALGHGINDSDTAALMSLGKGSIYATSILSISRGETDHPGQLTGVLTFEQEDYLGRIDENSNVGIFGTLDNEEGKALRLATDSVLCPVALKQEVKRGKAQIYCDIGQGADYYDVRIEQLYYDSGHENQGIMLTVTDERLLMATGGIVQGMSGSPIVQGGKIVGAVTHVFVKDASRGYGVFVENMLENERP